MSQSCLFELQAMSSGVSEPPRNESAVTVHVVPFVVTYVLGFPDTLGIAMAVTPFDLRIHVATAPLGVAPGIGAITLPVTLANAPVDALVEPYVMTRFPATQRTLTSLRFVMVPLTGEPNNVREPPDPHRQRLNAPEVHAVRAMLPGVAVPALDVFTAIELGGDEDAIPDPVPNTI
jgi:hypothetical protein